MRLAVARRLHAASSRSLGHRRGARRRREVPCRRHRLGEPDGRLVGRRRPRRVAIALGAGPFTIGLRAAIPVIAQVAQLPTIALIERVRDASASASR
jgi:hypothetical protein